MNNEYWWNEVIYGEDGETIKEFVDRCLHNDYTWLMGQFKTSFDIITTHPGWAWPKLKEFHIAIFMCFEEEYGDYKMDMYHEAIWTIEERNI